MAKFNGPKIVTDGLVLCLDAGNRKSYPGSGTAWTDLSGRGNIGELINSPTYNSSNLGYFQFVTDDYARIPNNTDLDTQTPSVEVWVKTNTTTQAGFWFEKGAVNTQYSLFQEGADIQWRHYFTDGTLNTQSTTTSSYLNTSDYFQVVGTYNKQQKITYINGIARTTTNETRPVNFNSGGVTIGMFNSGSYKYNGNIAIVQVYNRALSASEVLDNYNTYKSRFGLS